MADIDINGIHKIAIIMAGGTGDRLWPRSTEAVPKQFGHFAGFGSLIQNTVARLKGLFNDEDIYIVTNQQLFGLVKDQLPFIDPNNIILEPFGRNTLPCLGLAATVLHHKCTDETVMIALPADHFIVNVREYQNSVETAIRFAYDEKKIVTIGITPTRPETGFGYVQVKDDDIKNDSINELGVFSSSAFAEKPDLATAKRFLDSGDFLWNSGIFVWRIDTFWESVKKFLPDHKRLFDLLRKHVGNAFFNGIVEEMYRQMNPESVDYAILEKADNVFVVKSKFAWSDVGTWDELYRLMIKDARNNYITGNVIPINVHNCFVSSSDKLIGIVGVENLIVVEDENSIIICRKDNSDDVKEVVDFMKRKHITSYL